MRLLYACGQAVLDHLKAVVLAGDLDFACCQVLNGLVAAAVTQMHLLCFCTQ